MSSPSIVINIFYLKINSIDNLSGVNIGQSSQADSVNNSKRVQGYGQNYGDESSFVGNQGLIDDRDLIDTPVIKSPVPMGTKKIL